MAKHKPSDLTPIREKVFDSTAEISQAVEKLRERIIQVEELKRDGLPYRDALKVTTEYQIRDTLREIFGDYSPEFHEHRHYRIKVTSKAAVDETIALLQHFVLSLEEKRLDLLGLRPRPTLVMPIQTLADGPASQGHDQPSPSSHAPNSETSAPTVLISDTRAQPPVPAPAPAPQTAPVPRPAQHPMAPQAQVTSKPKLDDHTSPAPHQSRRHRHAHDRGEVAPSPRSHARHAMPQQEIPPTPASFTPLAPWPTAGDEVLPSPDVTLEFPNRLPQEQIHEPAAPSRKSAHDVTPPQEPTPVTRVEVSPPNSRPSAPSEPRTTGADTLASVEMVLRRFHNIARQLRQRSEDRPTLEVEDEIDVQDVLRTVLSAQFEDVETETWVPAYGNGTARTDLLLKREGVVIVVKKTRQGLGTRTLSDQLVIDLQRYAAHPFCKRLFCFVYDPEGRIGNPISLENALQRHAEGRAVHVIIAPK